MLTVLKGDIFKQKYIRNKNHSMDWNHYFFLLFLKLDPGRDTTH